MLAAVRLGCAVHHRVQLERGGSEPGLVQQLGQLVAQVYILYVRGRKPLQRRLQRVVSAVGHAPAGQVVVGDEQAAAWLQRAAGGAEDARDVRRWHVDEHGPDHSDVRNAIGHGQAVARSQSELELLRERRVHAAAAQQPLSFFHKKRGWVNPDDLAHARKVLGHVAH